MWSYLCQFGIIYSVRCSSNRSHLSVYAYDRIKNYTWISKTPTCSGAKAQYSGVQAPVDQLTLIYWFLYSWILCDWFVSMPWDKGNKVSWCVYAMLLRWTADILTRFWKNFKVRSGHAERLHHNAHLIVTDCTFNLWLAKRCGPVEFLILYFLCNKSLLC
jgi:hypothetical protein